MSEIKAIETVYNGYKFRSRLEARWAVLFDAGKIKYEYEPEGFELPDGTRYLPDFYLPEYDWYVEVKPNRDGACKDIERARRFVGDKIKVLLILGDIPRKTDIDLYHYPVFYYHNLMRRVYKGEVFLDLGSAADQEPYTYLQFDCNFGVDMEFHREINEVRKYNFQPIHDREIYKKMWHFRDIEVEFGERSPWCECADYFDTNGAEFINSCYDAARQARFEFCECG